MITVTLSESVVRKARALAILTGANPADFESTLLSALESAIDRQIVEAVGAPPQMVVANSPVFQAHEPAPQKSDEVIDGLGDEDPVEIEGLKDEAALIPTKGGLTDADLENDMAVEDPEHEAKVDAGTFADEINNNAENVFTTMAGLPPVDEIDHRIMKRKKRSTSRAKVSLFSGDEAV